MMKNKYITIPSLSRIVNKSESTIYRHIQNLYKKGLVTRVQSRKTGYWDVR